MLRCLAHLCYRRRWRVLLVWVVLLAGLSAVSGVAGGVYRDEFELPGSESQEATDLLRARGFPNLAGFGGQVVLANRGGFDDPALQRLIEEELLAPLESRIRGSQVVSPFTPEGRDQVSQDGTVAFAEVNLTDRDDEAYRRAGEIARGFTTDWPGRATAAAEQAGDPALAGEVGRTQVELGGDIFVDPQELSSEAIGLLAAMVILLIAFGSVLAMGLPIVTALFGIGTGIALVGLVVNLIDMPSFSEQAVLMIGIGVGIDYALFIVTRYREGLHNDLAPESAVVRAIDTAGRAVLFAGTTVILAVLGLFTIGLDMMNGVAVGISLGVLTTMLAAITLLPAVMGFVGTNIDKLGLPWRRRREGTDERTFWHRWSRVVQRRPWPALLVGAAALLALAVPLGSMRLGFGDAGNRPERDTTRQAYDLMSEGFGPGANGPFLLAAETPGREADLATLRRLAAELNRTPGVAFATPPRSSETGDAAVLTVIPRSAPQDEETSDLVHRLRDGVIPGTMRDSGLDVLVGGSVPSVIDFSDYMAERLPWFIATVLVLSFVLLMLVFRSLLVPVKAVVMNLVSIGAAYGLLVAVFQWGWGLGLLGLGREGPVELWIPMMLFAVVFGLSMDYEVFLLSRIREEYDRTGDNPPPDPTLPPSAATTASPQRNTLAVANGLASTARVITAAAAIMVFVFGAFMLGDERAIKMFGLGLSVAVLLDATVVRLVLVPSTMELLGDLNWWLPRWLDRILPSLHVEADEEVVAGTADELGERARVGSR
jgi:RND superfamily putative drug exporter